MSQVYWTDRALPTTFDLMSRRLNIASPYSPENKQPSARLCHLNHNNGAPLFVHTYSVVSYLSNGILCISRTVLIAVRSVATLLEWAVRPFQLHSRTRTPRASSAEK